VLELFPDSARVEGAALVLGGVPATRLAAEHGTPLVVYCEETIRAQARAYRDAAPGALVVYGTKAFANVAILGVLADEGVGADVSTLGELRFAEAAGIPGERLLFHGNNKSDEELEAAAAAGALVVLDGEWEVEHAAAAGVRRVLLRLTPGVDAATHDSIKTAHAGSKFGFSFETAIGVIAHARLRGLDVVGVHVHIGSQLARPDESVVAVERVVAFCEGLGLDPAVAFTILEWGRPAAIEPAALDPDIAALLRRWADPNLTEQERFHIRETVRYLAYRPGEQRHAS